MLPAAADAACGILAPEQNAPPASGADDDDGSGLGSYAGSDSGPMRMARAGGRAANLDDAPGVRRFLNLPYATLPGVDPDLLSLDLYAPATGQNHPVIVMVHGGGWQWGDKANANVAAQKVRFVAAGYIFVSVNYRLSPAVKHPAHVQDVPQQGMKWNYDSDPLDFKPQAIRLIKSTHEIKNYSPL